MDNETIFEWSPDLFEDFLNRFCKNTAKRISSIGAWLQMKELKYLIDNSSWNYPYAAFCRDETYKKLLPDFWNEDVFKGQREAFAKFYTMVNSVSLDDFLAIYPTLVKQPNELADLRSALEKDGAHYTTDIQWGYCIFEAIHTYEDYRRRSCEEINMERMFQGYLDNRGIVISDEIASKILVFTTMYPFSSRKRKEKLNAMEAYKLLNEGHCTPMKMLEIYMDFRKYIHKDVRYDNPARYIKAAKKIEYCKIDVGDEDAVNKACEALKKLENPSDFVGVVMEHINGENSRIETGFAQIRFLETLRPGDSILIINPSTYFVQSWPESLQSSTTFCVMNELERILLQMEFSQAKFCLADEVEISSYTKTLYFPRPTENAEQKELIHQICQKDFESSTKKVGLMMLISPKDELLSTIKHHYPGIFIDELPRRTVGVAPKRRILVTAIAGESSLRRHNQLMLYSPQTGLLRYNGNIPKGNETLYLIFAPKKGTANQSEKAERQARYLEFSRDIRIWYKQNNTYNGKIRVEANLYALPTMIQARRNKNQRGEKLPGTYGTKVCLDEEKKVEWLINRYPYSTKIQSVLAGVFRNKKQDICLKTAWYLSLDLDHYSKGLTQEKGSGDLMPYFGDMQVNETDPAKFREAMSKLQQDYGCKCQ